MNDVTAPRATEWTNLLDRLWRLLMWPRLTVILWVWVAVVFTLSAVIPQAPSQVQDPLVRSQWLAGVPAMARPAVERLSVFGVFDVLDSGWLRLPLVVWLAHSLVMLAHLGPGIWSRLKGQRGEMKPLGRLLQLDRNTSQPADDAYQRLTGRLEARGYRLLPGDEPGSFVAWRRRWSWLALTGIYLGLGLLSLGLMLTNWLGQVQEIRLQPGNLMPLPGAGVANLVLDRVTIAGNDPLKPGSGLASVRLVSGVGESQNLGLTLHRSRLLQGMWMTLVELAPVVEARASNVETGSEVLLQPFSPRVPAQPQVRLPLSGDSEARFVGVPSQNITLHIDLQADKASSMPESRDTGPVFLLSFFRGADPSPSGSAALRSGEEATFDGVRYRVIFDYDALLRINTGMWWIIIGTGWALAALSFVLLVVMPPITMRVHVQPAGGDSRISLSVDAWGDDQGRYRDLRELVSDVK